MANQIANIEKLYKVYEDIPTPIESYGVCARKRCNVYGILGDGYCVKCWDTGYKHKSWRVT